MVAKIVVPLDGSTFADQALPFATILARRSGATIVLVRSAQVREIPGADLMASELRAVSEAEEALAAQVVTLGKQNVAADPHVFYGDPAWSIVEAADRNAADLIVMSTHGRSGIGRWLLGSVAERVLRKAKVPVMLVSPLCQRAWREDSAIRVVVPLDGSAFAEEALPKATTLAGALNAGILLVRAVPAAERWVEAAAGAPGFDEESAMSEAERYLSAVADLLRNQGANVNTWAVVGDPATVLAEVTAGEEAALIVLASHGRSGLSRTLLGSVANATVRLAPVPVAVVRPAAVTRAEVETEPAASPFRCAVCLRPVVTDVAKLTADDHCPRCHSALHICRNCVYDSGTGCILRRAEYVDPIPGQHCAVFAFRWKAEASSEI